MNSYRKILVVMAVAFLAAGSVGAQAFTVPVSENMVQGQLELTDGEVIEFAVLDGGMLKVRDSEEGYFIGLTPNIADDPNGAKVVFTIFDITETASGLQSLVYRQTFEVAPGEKAAMVDPFYADVSIIGFEKSNLSLDEVKAMRSNLIANQSSDKSGLTTGTDQGGISTECCVSCGSVTACGCSVTMSCGSCCDSSCCGGGSGGPLQDSPTP